MLLSFTQLLLIAFAWALMLIGDIYGYFARRLRAREPVSALNDAARNNRLHNIDLDAPVYASSTLRCPVAVLIEQGWHEMHGDKNHL